MILERHDPAEGPPNLWQTLRGAVGRKPADKKRRIAVDDSKKLKGPLDARAHPLRTLERGVLTFCPDPVPSRDDELFALLETDVPPHPWFDSTSALPVGQTPAELRIARGRLQRALVRAAVRCSSLWCNAIDTGEFNQAVRTTGSKADVNLRAALGMIDRIWKRFPDDHPRVIVDRHGGRTRYGGALEATFDGASTRIVAETPTLSRYTLERSGSRLTVSFALGGDGRFFPVALASMTAKYVRDLLMLRLNRFFQGHLPRLKPTAGYYGDGRRYMTEIKPVISRLGLPTSQLVRTV